MVGGGASGIAVFTKTRGASMYTLYGYKAAGSAAVEAALEMAQADYRIVPAASWASDSALAELERINPLKQIPTLVLPDGGVMTESAAILIHLGLTFPESQLLPADPSLRAQIVRGLVYIAANCYSAIGVIDYPERWCDGDGAGAATAERIRDGARRQLHLNWEKFADIFSDAIASQRFLGGDAPGALDLLAVVVSKWSGTRAHLASARPQLTALLDRIEQHPLVAPVLARHWDA
jgi:GST-like protein